MVAPSAVLVTVQIIPAKQLCPPYSPPPLPILLNVMSFPETMTRSGQTSSQGRRHTTDHTGRSLTSNNTPTASRSSSVASNRSEPSRPSWLDAYEGVDTTKTRRKDSVDHRPKLSPRNSGKKLEQKPGSTGTSGWKALFKGDSDDKKKNKQKQKDSDKIVLTSRHAAAVKTRLAVDPKYAEPRRRSSASDASSTGTIMTGGTPTSHLTAAEQETRFPHSGPPSKRAGKGQFHRKGKKGVDVEMDLPSLTRIVSGDEKDEESERQREEWVMKRNAAAMRRFTVAEGMEDGIERGSVGSVSRQGSWDHAEPTSEEVAEGKVMKVEGTNFVGVELEGDAYTPRAKPKAGLGVRWKRDDEGRWKS